MRKWFYIKCVLASRARLGVGVLPLIRVGGSLGKGSRAWLPLGLVQHRTKRLDIAEITHTNHSGQFALLSLQNAAHAFDAKAA